MKMLPMLKNTLFLILLWIRPPVYWLATLAGIFSLMGFLILGAVYLADIRFPDHLLKVVSLGLASFGFFAFRFGYDVLLLRLQPESVDMVLMQ